MSFWPIVASGIGTHDGSVLLQEPLFTEASQYPPFIFHESSIPSSPVFLTVVLMITAPHETHPWLLMDGTTCVVAMLESGASGLPLGNVHVGLSHVPYHPGKAGSLLPYRDG